MSAKRKSFKVRAGNAHLTVYPWTHPASGALRWRYAWRCGQVWRYVTARTKEEAEAGAQAKLEALAGGPDILADLSPARRRWLEEVVRSVPPADEGRLLEHIRAMGQSAEIGGAVERFLAGRISAAGEETPHLATVRGALVGMAGHFAGRNVSDIHRGELEAWWKRRGEGCGWKRRKDIRAALVQFWRWALKDGIAGNDAVTVAERLPEIGGQHGERAVLDVARFRQIAGLISEEFRAWLVLGCFAGLRPEEIAPGHHSKTAKRGIFCEEIDWDFSCLRIAPQVSKVGIPRIVPLHPACRAGLAWAGIEAGMTGPVCLRNPAETHRPGHGRELAWLGKMVFGGSWSRNICRHSYGSYRNAVVRNLGLVAEEMGTSVAMLHKHYHNPRPSQEGEAWFGMTVPICSDETGVPMDAREIRVG